MMLFVLVRGLNGEGEVVDWFSSEEDAFRAAQRLGGDWTIYGKYFEADSLDIPADMNREKKLFLTEAQIEMLGGDAVKQFLSRYDEIVEIPDDWEGEP